MTVIPKAGEFEKRRPIALGHVRPGEDRTHAATDSGPLWRHVGACLGIFLIIAGSTAAGVGIAKLSEYVAKHYPGLN